MPAVKVHNVKKEEIGEINLADAVFGVELNESLIHAAVRHYMACGRQGTVNTKTRGEVSGSGRKLWKQKGTGRARIASIRSPLWKGGGNTHGPKMRDWSYRFPKKMRRGALRSAISERLREGNLIVLDEITFNEVKTRNFVDAMKQLGLYDTEKNRCVKTLIIDSLDNSNLIMSSRNVQRTKITNSFGLNIYDLLNHERVILTKTSAQEITELLDPQREKTKVTTRIEEAVA